ncbi:Wzz/FepE/Etk N-terminal domain-containing protein [Amycolatopsis alkalitolerans]|uniref:Exopolysaccharide biosynthesis protein n=1 Tax=Amycolatopsis alkalitolerans TaxID=2547244 RepID=A0A5C4MAU1_9PSEU|nr:Wzz/FepE/Etk N-terminal domain-containing protein [Amycolatopsis alkalitolerans]TNC28620.1 exopolysaccharide biosynthesis protein [Amycolatopsis alkalitolerans]
MTTTTSTPLVDLQRLITTVRRRRRMWLSAALLGLLAGIAVAVVLPAPPTAVTKLLVIHADDSPTDSGTLMRTDVAVLGSSNIADAALKSLHSKESSEDFMKEYQGLGLTNNVMQISVEGTSAADATAKAKALADTFVADHVQRAQASADAEAQALVNQRNQAQTELNQVDSQIATESARGSRANATSLESLYSRRADLTSKISDLDTQAQQAGIGSPQIAAGTRIVDAPRLVPNSVLKTAATDGGIGLLLGLVLGLALAAMTAVVRDRPVLRREISANLGASVIAQLPKRRTGTARKRVAATLVRLVHDDRGTVSLLELGAPGTTARLALDIAAALPDRTTVIDGSPDGAVRAAAGEVKFSIVDGGVVLPPAQPGELRLGVGSVRPGTAWTDLAHLGTETVLVVRAGYANTTWLHTVARQLADCHIAVIGIVLVDPDPKDRTDGTLWDALHTALRGRALPAQRSDATRRLAPVARNGSGAGGDPDSSSGLPTRQFVPVGSQED